MTCNIDSNRLNIINKYINKSHEYYEAYNCLLHRNWFPELQLEILYNSTLCYLKAYLLSSDPDNITLKLLDTDKQILLQLKVISLSLASPCIYTEFKWIYDKTVMVEHYHVPITEEEVSDAQATFLNLKKLIPLPDSVLA